MANQDLLLLAPHQIEQQDSEMKSSASYVQPMMAKLCQLLSHYSIQIMAPQREEMG
jgi:hypothetical protein